MKEAGWDIASHSLKWIEHKDMTEAEERTRSRQAIRIHTEATGARPLGWYTGRSSINTLRLVMEAGGLALSLRLLCRRSALLDQAARPKPHLVIPYSSTPTICVLSMRRALAAAIEFFTYLKDSFDVLYAEGATVAEDDVGGPALPGRRPAGPGGVADALSRLYRQP